MYKKIWCLVILKLKKAYFTVRKTVLIDHLDINKIIVS